MVTDPEAIMMMKNTTNTRTSSEVALEALAKAQPPEVLGHAMSHVMRYANFLFRLREAEELRDLMIADRPVMLSKRIQEYTDGLRKLGEENASNR